MGEGIEHISRCVMASSVMLVPHFWEGCVLLRGVRGRGQGRKEGGVKLRRKREKVGVKTAKSA